MINSHGFKKHDISSDEPDWNREYLKYFTWQPSKSLLSSIRQYQKNSNSKNIFRKFFLKKIAVFRHRFWSIITGADIPINCQIGGGLLLPHPNGVVIHPDAVIGPNCLIFQQVTIGMRNGGTPIIGGHVDIGAGAKLLGPVSIGAHATVGANAVVLHDVEAGTTVVGVPAKVLINTKY